MNAASIKNATVIGGGVIGGGWVARFLLMGCDVTVFDPDPEAKRKINEVIANARRSLPGLYEHNMPPEGDLLFADTLEQAVANAQWVSECVPERLEIKHSVIKQIQEHCKVDAIIASSTSGFKPSELQENSIKPEQIIVAHPFNPVYLVPLVELVGNAETLDSAANIIESLGMHPLKVRKEIDAHIADRLLEAVWREGLWLINDGIATTKEIDDAIIYGFGLRWAQMGLFETYRVAGGEAGMEHFIKQFGPCLSWPWTKLMDVPELTDELVQTIANQSDEQSGQHSIRELERIRDNNLVSIMRGLKGQNWGAGKLLNDFDRRLDAGVTQADADYLETTRRVIPNDWTDYNGHMNDSRYGEVFSIAVDRVMTIAGADAAYIASGKSYFTLDMQISYIDECHAGDSIVVKSRVSDSDGKKVRVQHGMFSDSGKLLANCEQLLIHVDLEARKSSLPDEAVLNAFDELAARHASLASFS